MSIFQYKKYGDYPWYTHCVKWDNYKPLNMTTVKAMLAASVVVTFVSPFLGALGLVGIVAAFITGFVWAKKAFDYFLGGKLICLGEENAILCGTVTHLEPPQSLGQTDLFDWLDNDYSWNLLVCPYTIIPRLNIAGRVVVNPVAGTPGYNKQYQDPEPYPTSSLQLGPLDHYCLETEQVTKLRGRFNTDYQVGGDTGGGGTVVAANVFARRGLTTANIQNAGLLSPINPADLYFTYLDQPNKPVSPLPQPFPFHPKLDPNGNAIPVFGQGDDPSGRAYGHNPGDYDSFIQYDQTIGTTGLSAQIHCEIEGSRIYNTQTGVNVALTASAIFAALATATLVGGPFGLAIFFLLAALAALFGFTYGYANESDDPNVGGGSDKETQPNSGVEKKITNSLNLHVGDFVVVVGRWVFDMWHCPGTGSNEIHPVKQVYIPTAKTNTTDFCGNFFGEIKAIINSSISEAVAANQSLPQYDWTVHPAVDGCGNYEYQPPPPIPK